MKCVPVHHGIPAVLHRDEPWLHRHSENGALLCNNFILNLLKLNELIFNFKIFNVKNFFRSKIKHLSIHVSLLKIVSMIRK